MPSGPKIKRVANSRFSANIYRKDLEKMKIYSQREIDAAITKFEASQGRTHTSLKCGAGGSEGPGFQHGNFCASRRKQAPKSE